MNAVVTLCIGEEYNLGEVTHPLLKAYADKVGADFIIIDKPKLNLNYVHFEKYQVYDLLEDYERIIFLDTDIIVNPQCPNLFELVPEDKFGAFVVSKHTYFHDGAVKDIQKVLGDIGWKREYFNSGVMVVSKCHREVFNKSSELLIWASEKRAFLDQTLLNYHVQKQGIPIYDIGYQLNHTTDPKNSNARFGRRINQLINLSNSLLNSIPKYKKSQEAKLKNQSYIIHYKGKEFIKHRFQSYIIHYTGKGHRKYGSKLEQIKKDLSILEQSPLFINMSSLPLLNRFI